ncbi:28S ribosomal protein S15, mitochondrial [Leptopilina heterotoma]|uniref:28S ribosomal protein S15, mitochondrial n=1 Tax=Leptopilina heterotoma TaxID=63436 RepID=UPI001CA9D160|nr:28S ribosomal protein S15, mitochondrial [Leptopilina heterotoma]
MNAFTYLVRRAPTISNLIVRNYAPKPFTMQWVRPEKPSCISTEKSGDLGLEYNFNSKELCPIYRELPEIENCSEDVKKLLSLEFHHGKETARLKASIAEELVENHENDPSFEVSIARLTADIHYLQEHMKNNPRNRRCKVALKEKIDKRKKFLKKLRSWDYKRFEWILEKLNLVYKPQPEKHMFVTRKGSIRLLLQMHCNEIRQEKRNAYRVELESQQKGFFEKKAKQLAFIREEEIFCGLEPTITEEDIENAKKKAASL